ncbi:MAG: hypothetical protein Cons2KO_09970 [Congregibacter sp.]
MTIVCGRVSVSVQQARNTCKEFRIMAGRVMPVGGSRQEFSLSIAAGDQLILAKLIANEK